MKNDIPGNVRKTAYSLLGLLVLLLVYISYVQIIEQDFLTGHPLNRRNIEAAAKIPRGQILDRNGEKLAISTKDATGRFQRDYPFGVITAHVVGYDSAKYGTSGVESIFNGYLSGMGNSDRHLGPIARILGSNAGNNVVLTIDTALQKIAYQALGNNKGAVVVLAPRTGAILAMVSKPAFDPAEIDEQWGGVTTSLDAPLLNRAVQGLYPPGSSIKVMIAEAALAENKANLNSIFDCLGTLQIGPDYLLSEINHKAHGHISLKEALAVSCNITFGQLSLALGRDKMANTFERYGFGKSLEFELQESACRIPNFNSLGDGDLAQMGIGQSSLLVTPLRMAMLAEVFANHGVMMKPFIINRITAPDGTTIKQYQPQEWLRPTNSRLADQISAMMVAVVEEGTGGAAGIAGIQVAGKTGTAENPHGASHAWFIGFAPEEDPQIAVAVIVENGGSGGGVAAPIARRIIMQALR